MSINTLLQHVDDVLLGTLSWIALHGRLGRELDLHQSNRFPRIAYDAEVTTAFLHYLSKNELRRDRGRRSDGFYCGDHVVHCLRTVVLANEGLVDREKLGKRKILCRETSLREALVRR